MASNSEGHCMAYNHRNDLRCASPPQGRPFFASFFWARKKMKSPKAWEKEKGGIITNTFDKQRNIILSFFASVRNVNY